MHRVSISRKTALNALFALVLSSSPLRVARAQFLQQGGKLVGTDASGTSAQGYSVALSTDGKTAIVGGPTDNVTGAAWVYVRSDSGWVQQGAKLFGAGAIVYGSLNFGCSVALSADGNTAIVGGKSDNSSAGAAWVFTRSNGVWRQQGGKLVGTGAIGTAQQGRSVALSADGNTAIVGGPYDNAEVGAAWVFTRSGGVWRQQGGKLLGIDAAGIASQGSSVALSADGNTAIVGGGGDDRGTGALWEYTRTGDTWNQAAAKLVGLDAVTSSFLGTSVALSGDGNTIVTGGYGDKGQMGAAWVFTRANGSWSQQSNKLVGRDASFLSSQGWSVALSADGNTAVVGGPGDMGQANGIGPVAVGAAWVYTRSGASWGQRVGKLVGTGGVGPSAQGNSVALSGDGNTLLLGGPLDGTGAGATWAFVIPPGPGPSIGSGAVVNGASLLPGIAPATWMTIQGSNLSATTRTWSSSDFSGTNLPTQLDGVSVTVNGNPAYVYYISATQLNVLTPDDSTLGSVPVQVSTSQGASNIVNATESAFSAGLFTFSTEARTYAAAVRADGTYLGPATPAKPGDIILLFGTGFGPTMPPSAGGQLVNPAAVSKSVTVLIGGFRATVQSATLISPGLYQVNLVVPNVLSGDSNAHDYAVFVAIGDYPAAVPIIGATSQPNVFLTVQQ